MTFYHYLSSPQCAPHIGTGMTVLMANEGKMWAPHCMKLEDCKKYKSLKFNCFIQILDVEYVNNSKQFSS